MEYENQILHGECLPLLKQLPDECIDAFVSDVPYGLGEEPTIEEIIAYLQGADLVTGDFMGKDWEIPSVPTWLEIYRVLKPGAHLLIFGGTRTWDLISMGLRAAGFENRDTIADEFPALQWVHSQGMPKSHNVTKALKKQGEEEAPEGLGTGLKPAWEPILVYRKPFKGTIAANVLKHGTAALNIDATRVKHSSPEDFEAHKKQVEGIKKKGGVRGNSWKNDSDLSGANDVTAAGRWPANLILEHAPGCKKAGFRRVTQSGDVKGTEPSVPGTNVYGDFQRTSFQAYSNVMETWQCVPGCPVAELDAQSGNRPSTLTGRADPSTSHEHPGSEFNANSTFLGERTYHSAVYADAGGASRFFQQFEGAPFRYVAKASRREAGGGEFKVLHPTLKPLSLMRYLVKLVTPPGGLVLDPYCGSGTTCHAAYLERMRYVGMEKYEEPWQEAIRRMEVAIEVEEARRSQEDAFSSLEDEEQEEWS